MEVNFNPAIESGITSNEFVKLMTALGVSPVPSRMSVFNWMRNQPPLRRGEYVEPVQKVLQAISAAYVEDTLPLPITCKRVDRINSLKTAVLPFIKL